MSDSLVTYLGDHLGGSAHAIELLKTMRDHYETDPLGQFAGELLTQVEADRDVLRDLAQRFTGQSSDMKELAGRITEMIGRLKMSHSFTNGLGTFEALEFLELGIHGKWALWRALAVAAETEPRLQGTDFERLIDRAAAQQAQVEQRRIALARTIFGGSRNDDASATGAPSGLAMQNE
jgi:hypothetical protein